MIAAAHMGLARVRRGPPTPSALYDLFCLSLWSVVGLALTVLVSLWVPDAALAGVVVAAW